MSNETIKITVELDEKTAKAFEEYAESNDRAPERQIAHMIKNVVAEKTAKRAIEILGGLLDTGKKKNLSPQEIAEYVANGGTAKDGCDCENCVAVRAETARVEAEKAGTASAGTSTDQPAAD